MHTHFTARTCPACTMCVRVCWYLGDNWSVLCRVIKHRSDTWFAACVPDTLQNKSSPPEVFIDNSRSLLTCTWFCRVEWHMGWNQCNLGESSESVHSKQWLTREQCELELPTGMPRGAIAVFTLINHMHSFAIYCRILQCHGLMSYPACIALTIISILSLRKRIKITSWDRSHYTLACHKIESLSSQQVTCYCSGVAQALSFKSWGT